MSHIRALLFQRLLATGEEGVAKIRAEALEKGLDFYSHTVATLFEKPIADVTTIERQEAKGLLFTYTYGTRAP